MQLKLTLRARRLAVAIVGALLAALLPAVVLADEESGDWTGAVLLRLNYYYEDSTRVVAPDAELELESPKGNRAKLGYFVDTITSASIAAGALEDVRFTEVRHEVTAGGGTDVATKRGKLALDGAAKVSKEPDYLSASLNLHTALSVAENATTLNFDMTYLHDEIRQSFRGGAGIRPTQDGGSTAALFREDLDAIAFGVSWEQVLTPRIVLQLGYDLGIQKGFLANAYRSVAGGQRAETHPDNRVRNTVSSRLAWYIPQSRTSLQFLVRAYGDTWEIFAFNPELRLYQEAGRSVQFRFKYRYYKQSSSYFYRSDQTSYTDADRYVTADPKMAPFRNHESGLQILVLGEFLAGGKLNWLRNATFDLSFDYIVSSSAYGNGVVAIAGTRIPF